MDAVETTASWHPGMPWGWPTSPPSCGWSTGDLVYLASTSDGAVHEVAAATLSQVRTFAVNSPSDLALR